MKKTNWQKKILILIPLFIFLFLLSFNTAQAGINDSIKFKAQTTIPGVFDANKLQELTNNDTSYIALMIKGLYNYGIGIAGILAAIMLMAGGLVWLTSAGSSEKISKAKNLMSGSIVGLVLLFSSWMMLRTINPALVDFRIKTVDSIQQVVTVCCEYGRKAESMYNLTCDKKNGKSYEADEKGVYIPSNGQCKLFYVSCNIRKDCDDEVLWCLDSDTKITTRQKCGGDFEMSYEQKAGRCIAHEECYGKIANCLTQKDGQKCQETGSGVKIDGFCYYSMCYTGRGSEAESCGTEIGATCYSSSCRDLGTGNDNYYRDNSGGRTCNSGLNCCYKNIE